MIATNVNISRIRNKTYYLTIKNRGINNNILVSDMNVKNVSLKRLQKGT